MKKSISGKVVKMFCLNYNSYMNFKMSEDGYGVPVLTDGFTSCFSPDPRSRFVPDVVWRVCGDERECSLTLCWDQQASDEALTHERL